MPEKDEAELGFPKDTPIAEMTIEQQAAYWKHQSRKHEGNARQLKTEVDALKAPKPEAKPKEEAKVEAKAESEAPKFDAEAFKAELKRELRLEQAPELVRARFSSIIGTRMAEDARNALLDDLNLSKFVKEDGSLDDALIKERAEALAPAQPSSHLGSRRQAGSGAPSSVQKGRDLYAETHPTN